MAVVDAMDRLDKRLIADPATYESIAALAQQVADLERANTDLRARLARLEMVEAGYVLMPAAAYLADAQACEKSRCGSCGHQGRKYEAWWNQELDSYRAFAVCPKCPWREEW